MPADEVRTLITGNTAEGERRQGERGGHDSPGKVVNFAEKFVMYFAADGRVQRKTGGPYKTANWRVTESGKLCLEWKGRKEKCAPVYRDGKACKRVTQKSSGRLLCE